MSELPAQQSETITLLEERVSTLARDKSYLQMVINLMSMISSAQGLENMVETLLHQISNILGGTTIVLYYLIDDSIYYADLTGAKQRLDRIDDAVVKMAFERRECMEFEHDSGATQLLSPEAPKTYTWVFPLITGTELVGIIKLENLHISMNELYGELPTLFTGIATLLKNEIFSRTQLKLALEQMTIINEDHSMEVKERIKTEGELRAARDELEDSQRALMNIVEDLNEKTTELENANARLQELERLKSMFIASMSHELRTPLNSIIGFSSILHDEWLGPVNVEQKENLGIILRCGKHLLSLINDVIDVSKVEAMKIESVPEEFDLKDLIDEAVSLVQKDMAGKGLELRVESIHQSMHTDRRRLLQCVLNLMGNAVKFTESGFVAVSNRVVPGVAATPGKVTVEISVTDTGMGIKEGDLKKLFQPFVRITSPDQAIIPGTGLGLYLSRKLAAEVLQGDIVVTSEYGTGSTFTITLPVRIP
jgi:signal transduction histidine kinase